MIEFPIERGAIMMFARSINDPNPIYWDSAYAESTEVGHIIAPPTFVVSIAKFDPSFPLRPTIGEPWVGSGREPSGRPPQESGSGLAAEQHFEYFRHFEPGEVLTATSRTGETWQREGRRGGTLTFVERITDYHDAQGAIVVTARSVSVRTSKRIEIG